MRENLLLQKLKRGDIVIGSQNRSRSPLISELFGFLGLDYVFIENEHFPYNPETIESAIRACEVSGITPVVRIPKNDPTLIMQTLDMGAMAIIVPHIDTKEEAEAFVHAAKYAPKGNRGFSNTSRATQFGLMDMKSYLQMANRETMTIAMIESKEALSNLEGIIEAGIDCLHIGHMDLSESLGYGGAQDHEEVKRAIEQIIYTAKKHHVPVAFPCGTVASAQQMIQKGVQMVSFSSDLVMLSHYIQENVSQIKSR